MLSMTSSNFRRRLVASLTAGSVAIALNTLLLKAAGTIHPPTARGGLLRLITPWFAGPLDRIGITLLWAQMNGPALNTPLFQASFHLFVGMLMALFYGFILEPALPRGTALKGWIYTIGVWILNANVVLPLTGEGSVGAAHLTLAGMAWYAAAHTVFFLLLAYLFTALMRRSNCDALYR
jgi:hypothetical protein